MVSDVPIYLGTQSRSLGTFVKAMSQFTPSIMPAERLESLFVVVRHHILDNLMGSVKELGTTPGGRSGHAASGRSGRCCTFDRDRLAENCGIMRKTPNRLARAASNARHSPHSPKRTRPSGSAPCQEPHPGIRPAGDHPHRADPPPAPSPPSPPSHWSGKAQPRFEPPPSEFTPSPAAAPRPAPPSQSAARFVPGEYQP